MTDDLPPLAREFRRIALPQARDEPGGVWLGSLDLGTLLESSERLPLVLGEINRLWKAYRAWVRSHSSLSGRYCYDPMREVSALLGVTPAPFIAETAVLHDGALLELATTYTREVDRVCAVVAFLEVLPLSVVHTVGTEELVQDFFTRREDGDEDPGSKEPGQARP